MKMMKWALLGSAALAVTATAARADDLAELKAQIEALQSRVSQLESQPQAAMPSGYSLMAIRDGQGTYEGVLPERNADRVRDESGFTLSVLPTADAAPVAEVSVSGEIRTALVYRDDQHEFKDDVDSDDDFDLDDDALDVKVRGRIFIKGKVDTAVGEVGGYFRLEGATSGDNFTDYDETTKMNKAYGWWKFAPEWELMAGYNDNTATLQVGWDWVAATGPTNSFGPTNINNEQMRLTYASGPLSFAIALEDPDGISAFALPTSGSFGPTTGFGYSTTAGADKSDLPNVQAYLMYSSDAFTAQLVGLLQDDNTDSVEVVLPGPGNNFTNEGGDLDWAIGGGGTIGIMDAFQVSAAAVVGEGTRSYANNIAPYTNDEEFWAGSIAILANLSEDTRLELGVGYEDYDVAGTALGFGGGIYWDPVSQVTIGVGATYVERDIDDTVAHSPNDDFDSGDEEFDTLQVFFGTWLRFP